VSPATPVARRALRAATSALLELVFPTRCVGCGTAGTIWCAACRSRLVPAPARVCLSCRTLLDLSRRHACPAHAPWAVAFAVYRFPLDRALTHLKYRPDARLARILGDGLLAALRRHPVEATHVVPVPLGARRLRQRGYNQAELLGRALAESLALPLIPLAVARIRETESQVGLDPAARWANVAGAFRADSAFVGGRSILLVDDVHTTGATLAACAEAMLAAGAERVVGLTVGRA